MKQRELIALIAKDANLRYDVVRKVLRKLTLYTCVAIEQGEQIRFGLGTFQLRERPPKQVHNFKTNNRYIMGPTNQIVYFPSAYVKITVKKANVALQEQYEAELKNVK